MKNLPDIIIPHHNRWDLIGGCLEKIPMEYKVFIVRGFTFAEGCNKGASLSKADKLLFLNDDVVLTKEALAELQEHDEDIVGIPLRIPSLEKTVYGMNMYWGKYGNVNNLKDSVKTQLGFENSDVCQIPVTGAAFMIKRKVFEDLGGLNEIYKNGGEDNELYLKAMEKGYSFGYINSISDHFHSSSAGRYDYDDANHRILSERFPKKRLLKILGDKVSTNVLISVIIPTRKIIGKPISIKYIKEQTHNNIEIILIKDKHKKGASWARNKGRKLAKGKYLFFCDDDIELKPIMLEVLLTKLHYSNASFAYCNYDRQGEITGQVKGVPWDIGILKSKNYISTMSLIKTEDFPEEGFDETLNRFQDWDLWLRMAEQGKYGLHINETLFIAHYGKGDISCNRANLYQSINEIKKKHHKFIINKNNSMTIRNSEGIRGATSDSTLENKKHKGLKQEGLNIELGGKNPIFVDGHWQHLDIQAFPHTEYTTDSFTNMPFEDDTVEEIFAKRTIQRLNKKDAILALKDWFRVLSPFGSVKLVVVDINKAMGKYLQTFEEKYLDLIYGKQTDKTEFYLYGYTPSTLKKLMIDVGFINVRESTPSVNYFDPQVEFILEADKPKIKK